jgi:hypothetical protein
VTSAWFVIQAATGLRELAALGGATGNGDNGVQDDIILMGLGAAARGLWPRGRLVSSALAGSKEVGRAKLKFVRAPDWRERTASLVSGQAEI